ncbi:MAG: hypothetical protein OQK76_02445 [Gammaproteobacteria bacterium]|nr:hypothetical protein [Gammaproteobacteria bacterium]MCW8909459.1 hypothetical protein [Gammaproteobacteria bacterium]MCW9003863.1 hypothetical protein [Gammaproteobacteria bacterium]MCW9055026.1 hypothetical protein [Gammaproteobacteria bacterium]
MTAFNKTGLVLISTLIGLSHNTYAACSRDDVDYYLTKGFSTDQITTLCATSSSPPTHITGKEPASATQTSEQPVSNNNTELFLREAIKGRNVVLTNHSLAYTLKVCIKYGEEDLYGFAPKACPNVRFILVLNDLEIKEPVKKLFFNPDEIEVTGDITRNIIDGLEKYTTEEQTLILNKLESGNKTAIPVRDDISIDRVFQALEQLTL